MERRFGSIDSPGIIHLIRGVYDLKERELAHCKKDEKKLITSLELSALKDLID